MQIFNIIIGIIAIFCGIYSIFWPADSFMNAGWFTALVLLLWGICAIVTYILDKKQRGDKDRYNATIGVTGLVFGIIAVVVSILAIFIKPIQGVFMIIILVTFMLFLITSGIQNIVRAILLKKELQVKGWVLMLILGILQLIAAIVGICNWFFTAGLISVLFGIMLLIFGVTLIIAAFAPDPIDRFRKY